MNKYRYCWSSCAFSILLSLARLFWNQILICVSVSLKEVASSNLRPLEMYSPRRYSTSNLSVCSPLNVVLCLRGRPSFLLLRATAKKKIQISRGKTPDIYQNSLSISKLIYLLKIRPRMKFLFYILFFSWDIIPFSVLEDFLYVIINY